MTREDVAKAYIQSAQNRAGRSGVIAFGAGLALVALWSLELQDRTGGLLRALADKPLYSALSRQREAIASDNAVNTEKLSATKPDSRRSRKLSRYVEGLRTEAGQIDQQAGTIEQRTETARTVTFTLPGFPSITVRDASAALVWLACAAALLHYLSWCRRSVLRLYSRALRILVSEANVDPAVLHDIAGPLPFWIAPLPRADGIHVSATLLRSAAGWDRTSVKNHLGLGVVQLAAGLVALHVMYLGVLYSQLDVQTSGSELLFKNTPVLSTTVILGLIFVGITFWWLTPGRVPDNFSFEAPPPQALGRGRRALIVTGLGLVAAAIALVAVSPSTVRNAMLRPRFRRWANRGTLAEGLYEAGRDKRIHIARGKGRPKALKSVPDRYISRVEIDKDQLNRLHRSARDMWLSAASDRFKTTEYDLAREGMDRDVAAAKAGQRPTLMWFDYLAEEAWNADNSDRLEGVLAQLDAIAATTGGREIDTVIKQRRGTWRSRIERRERARAAKPNATKS